MEAVRTYGEWPTAQADRSVLVCHGVPAYVNGCARQGYSVLVASGLLARAKQILETFSPLRPPAEFTA